MVRTNNPVALCLPLLIVKTMLRYTFYSSTYHSVSVGVSSTNGNYHNLIKSIIEHKTTKNVPQSKNNAVSGYTGMMDTEVQIIWSQSVPYNRL